jgi:hypothetical protein
MHRRLLCEQRRLFISSCAGSVSWAFCSTTCLFSECSINEVPADKIKTTLPQPSLRACSDKAIRLRGNSGAELFRPAICRSLAMAGGLPAPYLPVFFQSVVIYSFLRFFHTFFLLN